MKKTAYLLAAFLVMIVLLLPAQAGLKKYGQAGMTFLKIDASGRSAAMGSAATAIIMDASAMFNNPAGLGFVQGGEAILTQTSWIADIKHLSGAFAYGHPTWGTVGVSFINMDYGTMQEAFPWVQGVHNDAEFEAGYVLGREFSPKEYCIGLGYSKQITSQFSFGVHIKRVHQNLYESLIKHEIFGEITLNNKQDINAFDFGTLYYTGWKDLRVAMSARNFSQQGKYVTQRFELPLTFSIGTAMDVLKIFSQDEQQQLTVALDWQHPRDYEERYHIGIEYGLMNMFFFRGGYKFNYDEESITGGIGLMKNISSYGMKIDYAYGHFGEFFGAVHRFSLGIFLK